jgi:hypothetical protein
MFLLWSTLVFAVGWGCSTVYNKGAFEEAVEKMPKPTGIWQYYVRIPQDAFKPEDTWWQKNYQAFNASFSNFVSEVMSSRLEDADTQAEAIEFEYMPWMKWLIHQTEIQDDLPYKKEKLDILHSRYDALSCLLNYLRDDYDKTDYNEYRQIDREIRRKIEENPEILK